MSANHVIGLLMFGCLGLGASSLTLLILWIRARERALRNQLKHQTSDDRIEHLVNAVDAIAIEVERVSEGQRFTTQVLTQGPRVAEQRRVLPPERVITPH